MKTQLVPLNVRGSWVSFFVLMGMLAFISAPLNLSLLEHIRYSDIFAVIAAGGAIFYIKFRLAGIVLVSAFCFLFFASALSGVESAADLFVTSAFFYKYIFLVMLVFIASLFLADDRGFFWFSLLFVFVYFFLISWGFFYKYGLQYFYSGYISPRISFPSNNYEQSDGHLYSFVLGFFILTYMYFYRHFFRVPPFISLLLVFSSLFVLVATGSRTGVFLLSVLVFFRIFVELTLGCRIFRNLLVLVLLVVSFVLMWLTFGEEVRAFQFDLFSDESSSSRVRKLSDAFVDYSKGYFLVGVGPAGASHVWYDGFFSALLVHFGPLVFLLIFLLLVYVCVSILKVGNFSIKLLLFSMLGYVFLGSLITEYILSSRGALLVFLPLAMFFHARARLEMESNN
ncbi:hypothetical protein [Stutzerimonas nitrititolerans]|uniref:hypothetical protein n=1 Tax=Stutzerimonas nitrititolerans TaxID=2482751 RepID=UPI00289CB35D|nr:hypothetical protein [Stutzerimonas nitrititolerans]